MNKSKKYINATGDICVGDRIIYEENVYPPNNHFKRKSPLGVRSVYAEVLRDSYGEAKQQHTFTIRVIKSSGVHPLESGREYRRKGRTIYGSGVKRELWENEKTRDRVLTEKHSRGRVARRARDIRKYGDGENSTLFRDSGEGHG